MHPEIYIGTCQPSKVTFCTVLKIMYIPDTEFLTSRYCQGRSRQLKSSSDELMWYPGRVLDLFLLSCGKITLFMPFITAVVNSFTFQHVQCLPYGTTPT